MREFGRHFLEDIICLAHFVGLSGRSELEVNGRDRQRYGLPRYYRTAYRKLGMWYYRTKYIFPLPRLLSQVLAQYRYFRKMIPNTLTNSVKNSKYRGTCGIPRSSNNVKFSIRVNLIRHQASLNSLS